MCGICGIIDLENKVIDESLVRGMCSSMRHRGPDGEGVYFNYQGGAGQNFTGISVALGHRRLSIIDLSESGKQPMPNEDRSVWLVCNGEIYNYLELKKMLEKRGHIFRSKTDTEVIIHLYEEAGEGCVKQLRGMFALAIWDQGNQKLLLARDRVGKKPLLYSFVEGKYFIFASEFNALLKYPFIERKVNLKAINYFLTYLCVPGPLTAFQNIYKLLPAHILVWQNGLFKTRQYWNLDFSKKILISENDAKEEVHRLLIEAVRIRLASDVPLGAFLSGGVDSSIVVALMSRLSQKPIETFSIGFSERRYNELPFARIIAERFNARHHEFTVRPNAIEILPRLIEHYGEPFADSSAIPSFYLAQLTKEHVTVALNGDGGDELFAGYKHHLANRLADYYYRLPPILRNKLIDRFVLFFPRDLPREHKFAHLRRFLEAANLPRQKRYQRWVGVFSEDLKRSIYSHETYEKACKFDSSDILNEKFEESNLLDAVDSALFVDTMLYLPNDLLVKMDIATMASSLEARSPFLDHCLMEFVASLPSKVKLRGFTSKYILKKAFKNIVPAENLNRDKKGFAVPIGFWFKGELKDYLKSILLSSQFSKRGYFKSSVINSMVQDHLTGRQDYAHHLWILLMLELWHQKFID